MAASQVINPVQATINHLILDHGVHPRSVWNDPSEQHASTFPECGTTFTSLMSKEQREDGI